jgi:glucose dehydrogenase
LTIETREPVSGTLSVRLPAERIADKAVLLDVWRKAENVETGQQHYYNAKSMLVWKARSVAKPQYSGTTYSDFSGAFDWERHRYVIKMPDDLEWAAVTVGMQACTGKASWAKLTVSVDARLPNQQALVRLMEREERLAHANLDAESLTVKRLTEGFGVC